MRWARTSTFPEEISIEEAHVGGTWGRLRLRALREALRAEKAPELPHSSCEENPSQEVKADLLRA